MNPKQSIELLKELLSGTKWGNVLVAGISAGQGQYILLTTAGADQRISLIGAALAAASALFACAYDSSKKTAATPANASTVEKAVEIAAGTVIPATVQAVAPDLVRNVAKEASRVLRRGIKF